MHPAGLGRVTVAQRQEDRWRETSISLADLPYAVGQLRGEHDVYLTQNRFFGPRRVVRLAELNALFADLDYYRTPLAEAHPRHVLDLALGALAQAKLPAPSFAISTGRGLALVWLHSPVPRWRACQQVLHDTLRQFGADRLATDAARVLRLVGTRNSISRTAVEALTPVGQVWDFSLLADEVLPLLRADLIALRLERAKRRGKGQTVPRPARYFTAASLWELRLSELQRLLDHRWFGVLPPGQRDLWLLLAATATSYLVPAQMVRREVCALAAQATGRVWSQGQTASRMGAVINRAERAARGGMIEYAGRLVDPRYRFCTSTIIDLLGVTEAEMRACGFRHLVSPEIKTELERDRWHARRAATGGLPRVEYLERSLSHKKPWDSEGISRATWYRRRETSPSGCMVA